AASSGIAVKVPTLAEAADRIAQELQAKSAPAADAEQEPEDAEDEAGPSKNRPASAALQNRDRVAKTPAAAHVPVIWERPPPCPRVGSPATLFKGAKIYVSDPQRCLRVIRDATKGASEVKVSFCGDKPTKARWLIALQKVDEYK
ncbi:unnamed protein product, partial [Prorocentrum cordatum]